MPQPVARPDLPRHPLWGDGLLLLSALLAAGAVAWFVLVVVTPVGPIMAGWLLSPVCVLVTAALCGRTGSAREVAPAARRFWRGAGVALVVFAVAMVWRTADSANGDGTMTDRLGMTSATLYGAGILLLLWSLLRLPLGTKTRTQRVSLWLDVATLTATSAVYLWHFAAAPALTGAARPSAAAYAGVALLAFGLLAVFVVAKVVLTGSRSLERGALKLLGAALAVGGLGSALTTPLVDRTYVTSGLLIVPVACFLIGLGARRQMIMVAAPGLAGSRAGHRYSVLPYLAVAATDGLLITVMLQDGTDRLPISLVATALTGVVVARQIMAFRENEKLLTRLDAGLLELGLKERRFRLLVQNSTDVVNISDANGMVDYISDAVQRVLGHAPEAMVRTDLGPLVHPDDREHAIACISRVAEQPGNSETYRVRMAHADGSWRCLEVISVNLSDESSVAGIVNNFRDVTETLQVQERLSYQASHDALTGLANRALFSERIGAGLGGPRPVNIVLIDLDDFKTVNDTLGHPVGDALLVTVAQRMRDSVGPGDTVARLGGDEFAILLEGLDGDAVDRVLARIAERLREPVHVDGHVLSVRASFGVAEGGAGDDATDLLRQADIAMYEAKERGEGGYQRYESGMQARGAERNRLTAALRDALDRDEFVLHYQPVVAMPGGRLIGVEALVRWQHPDRGLLGPGEFIADAEQTGMIVPLGRWVLREACRQAARWQAECGSESPETVSVNVSARQLLEPGFAAEVADALRAGGLPARRLTIEITESTAVGGGATRATLRALRAMGVRLSLDDFGTGASTLSLLATCPVDEIKLDRSFAPIPGPDAIANAVVQLAKAFGVEVIAEGVETAAQAQRLQSLGYVRAQGFLFARPMTPAAISASIQHRAGREVAAA
jgi:diguanylate cyclase (GGDEF)-like protein/PAS domain S-box-containing protein